MNFDQSTLTSIATVVLIIGAYFAIPTLLRFGGNVVEGYFHNRKVDKQLAEGPNEWKSLAERFE